VSTIVDQRDSDDSRTDLGNDEQAAADGTQSPTEVAALLAELRRGGVDPQLTRQLRLDIERNLLGPRPTGRSGDRPHGSDESAADWSDAALLA